MTEQLEGQMSIFDADGQYGKMSAEHSVQTKERTSKLSSRRSAKSKTQMLLYLNLQMENGILPDASWEKVTQLPGVSTMLNFGESPNVENASTLSQILQENVPEKYFLSKKACLGILRRAKKRGKQLPDMLREALLEVAGDSVELSRE